MAYVEIDGLRSLLIESFASLDDIERRTKQSLFNLREAEIRIRRIREKLFPRRYFADVAWDILLDLDEAERQDRQVVTTEVCVEACVPLATMLRYLHKLEEDGFIERRLDEKDRRRNFVFLTDKARLILDQVFESAAQSDRILVDEDQDSSSSL